MNSSATVLIATKEFELFNKIIESNPKLNIRVLNLPQTNDEILKAVLIELETLKSNTEVVDRPSVEMEILGSFVDGTKDTIIEMSMDESIKSKKPLLLSEIKEDLSIGIRGRIVIQSKFFKGSFFISFPTESYLELYKMVVFEEHDAINEENQDFATELANIIYGKAKSNLNSKGYELGMVIPDLVFDKKLESKESILVIPYSGAFGNFYIKIAPNLV
jgi:CheY-specific phosphatase CheX